MLRWGRVSEGRSREASRLDPRMFLVIVPSGLLFEKARMLQQALSDRYQLYAGKLPPLHVTVEHLAPKRRPDFEEAFLAIRGVTARTRPFEVVANGFCAFPAPYRAINVHIEKTPELVGLSTGVNQALKASGISVRDSLDDWIFHLNLVSNTYATRRWSQEEFEEAFEWTRKHHYLHERCRVEAVELWYPEFEPELKVAGKFLLMGEDDLD